jgi:hypothetical protein
MGFFLLKRVRGSAHLLSDLAATPMRIKAALQMAAQYEHLRQLLIVERSADSNVAIDR